MPYDPYYNPNKPGNALLDLEQKATQKAWEDVPSDVSLSVTKQPPTLQSYWGFEHGDPDEKTMVVNLHDMPINAGAGVLQKIGEGKLDYGAMAREKVLQMYAEKKSWTNAADSYQRMMENKEVPSLPVFLPKSDEWVQKYQIKKKQSKLGLSANYMPDSPDSVPFRNVSADDRAWLIERIHKGDQAVGKALKAKVAQYVEMADGDYLDAQHMMVDDPDMIKQFGDNWTVLNPAKQKAAIQSVEDTENRNAWRKREEAAGQLASDREKMGRLQQERPREQATPKAAVPRKEEKKAAPVSGNALYIQEQAAAAKAGKERYRMTDAQDAEFSKWYDKLSNFFADRGTRFPPILITGQSSTSAECTLTASRRRSSRSRGKMACGASRRSTG